MKFTLTIETNNYAFTSDEEPTDLILGELLAKVARQVDDGYDGGTISDPVNGQRVGSWDYRKGETEQG